MLKIIDGLKSYHEKPCLSVGEHTHTYLELENSIEKYQGIIKKKIKKGQVVAIISDYSFDAVSLFFALASHECIVVPITAQGHEEIKMRLQEAYVNWSIGFDESDIKLTLLRNESPHQLLIGLNKIKHSGLIVFSSGSSGRPKAMLHDLDNLLSAFNDKKARSTSVTLVFLMFDHLGGLNTLFHILTSGSHAVIPKTRTAEGVAKLIEVHKVNLLPTSPTFLNILMLSGASKLYDLSSIKLITYGTEPMPQSVLTRAQETFCNSKFLQTFGTSETGVARTKSKSSDSTKIKFEDINNEIKVVDGELWIKSQTQILGYLNASMEQFTDDGWFKTGDMVDLGNDGFMTIKGRRTEMINIGGEKVLPGEVESILLGMEEVSDCIVSGIPNAITGQAVSAKVVISSDMDIKTLKRAIRHYCKDKIANYKIPTKISIVSSVNIGSRYKKIRR